MKYQIVFEDDDIVLFDKPSGLLSIPDRYNAAIPCLYHEVARQYKELFVVHRLDKDTSGLICFAKSRDSHKYMSQLFESREVEKYYTAIVSGVPQQTSGSIIEPIGEHPVHKGRMIVHRKGRPAHTDYEVIQSWKNFSLLTLRIHTGRTHQIRVHLQHLGHSIVGDEFYGNTPKLMLSAIKRKFKIAEEEEERPLLGRLALHASRLVFRDRAGNERSVTCPLPKDMSVAVKQLSKWNI